MELHPPTPCVVHPLAGAPSFVGRSAELRQLREFFQGASPGVIALVGLGGAGKTALASAYLSEVLAGPPRHAGIFVWSFYQEPDAGLFLEAAYRYFGDKAAAPARAASLLHFLRQALEGQQPHLLVLDGLERVQQPEGPASSYGQIDDPLLRGLLLRLAEGMGQTTALVTSRFPLTDLKLLEGKGYQPLPLGGLDQTAAFELLRRHGVQGDEAALARLVDQYGAHALTLDHLGKLIGQFLGGDPRRAPEAPSLADPKCDRQALRLARLLRAYEEHLTAEELALLSRLCLVRRNLTIDQVLLLFVCTPAVQLREIRDLTDADRLKRAYPSSQLPEVLDLLDAIRDLFEEQLIAAPVAGPAEVLLREVREVIHIALDDKLQQAGIALDDLARLYAGQGLLGPTDRLPLPTGDREALQVLHAQYVELRQKVGFEEQDDPVLQKAFAELGFFKKQPTRPLREDDLYRIQRTRRQLNYLAIKHCALLRIRQLCQAYQQKAALAGPLAHLDAAGFRQLLDTLVSRHLVLREADDSFSVHPAVKDHFARLAGAIDHAAWHDVLREQLVNLVRKPGKRLPDDAASLDLVEEAIHHSLSAGRPGEAFALYSDLLGGLHHLAWRLGELARGRRILRAFEPCPDEWALAWFERGLGELEAAYGHCQLPYFRADIRLLQGRLPEAAALGDDTRAGIACFLMGESNQLPPPALGCAIPRLQLLLYLGRHQQAMRSAGIEDFYREIGWEGSRARQFLLLADLACRQADPDAAWSHLHQAAAWILHSGSIEHLCLYYLVRVRVARLAGEERTIDADLAEGLHFARQCELGLLHIEHLCARAEIELERNQAESAATTAAEALRRATAVNCNFRWGAAHAGQLLGQALAAQNRHAEARNVLQESLLLCRRLGDPRAVMTERLMSRLPA